jgi:hypothetical protein
MLFDREAIKQVKERAENAQFEMHYRKMMEEKGLKVSEAG